MPGIKLHKKTGQFYVWVRKKRKYLGTDAEQAKVRLERYRRGEVEARPVARGEAEPPTVSEVLLAYIKARRAGGVPEKEVARIKGVARVVNRLYGREQTATFRAKALKHVRQELIRTPSRRQIKAKPKRRHISPRNPAGPLPITRRYINRMVNEVKAAWTWAASEEMVPAETAMSLRLVAGLRKGAGGREPDRIPAVEQWVVEATIPELTPVVAAMVRLQILTGMRPGELCSLRRGDISIEHAERVPLPMTNKYVAAMEVEGVRLWVAVPSSHKTLHRGKPRAVVLGPKAQEVVRPFIDGRDPADYLFSPKESRTAWLKAHERKVRVGRSRMPGARYTASSYGRSVACAVERANRKRLAAAPRAPPSGVATEPTPTPRGDGSQ
jgi:integrase